MKRVLEILRRYEQSLLFLLIIIYLNSFSIVFDKEMQTDGWVSAIWIIQFFVFGILYANRGLKKGWKYPKDIRNTH